MIKFYGTGEKGQTFSSLLGTKGTVCFLSRMFKLYVVHHLLVKLLVWFKKR